MKFSLMSKNACGYSFFRKFSVELEKIHENLNNNNSFSTIELKNQTKMLENIAVDIFYSFIYSRWVIY